MKNKLLPLTIFILVIIPVFYVSGCKDSSEKKIVPKVIAQEKKLTPLEKLSVELGNTLGFKLVEKDGKMVVESSQPHSPAYVAGLTDGMVVSLIEGYDINSLDDEKVTSIVDDILTGGDIGTQILQPDGSFQNLSIFFAESNCPQTLSSYFWFVETPIPDKPSTVMFCQIHREIKGLTFERKLGVEIELFDNKSNKWFKFFDMEKSFDDDTYPSNLPKAIASIPELSFSGTVKDGEIGFTGDFKFALKYEADRIMENPNEVWLGKGSLKVGDAEYRGFMVSRHVVTRFSKPFAKENEIDLWKNLPDENRYVEDRTVDWLFLFDSFGNAVEINMDGYFKRWWGMVYYNWGESRDNNQYRTHPPVTCFPFLNPYLDKCEITWLDDVVEGLEADPYPSDIFIEIGDNVGNKIGLKGESPFYQNDNLMISLSIHGKCSTSDGNSLPVAGYLNRGITPSG